MSEVMVTAGGVRKAYRTSARDVPVLHDVSATIARGEFVAIMGPSGCGKTTLLNCLAGLDEVDAGRVLVDGHDLARMSDRARTRHRAERMGFVFQAFNLLPVLSAVQNVETPLLLLGVKRKEARERALAALDGVGLAERAEHRPAELSGGQQQRVAIARALVNRPAIVWADEPTGNLDSGSGSDVLALLTGLHRDHGVTLVVVTHDAAVADAADRVIHLDSGRIVHDGAMAAATAATANGG